MRLQKQFMHVVVKAFGRTFLRRKIFKYRLMQCNNQMVKTLGACTPGVAIDLRSVVTDGIQIGAHYKNDNPVDTAENAYALEV